MVHHPHLPPNFLLAPMAHDDELDDEDAAAVPFGVGVGLFFAIAFTSSSLAPIT